MRTERLIPDLTCSRPLLLFVGPSNVAPSTLVRIFRDGRATVEGWQDYKHQTGQWPWFSIAVHILNWVLVIFGAAALVWWAEEYRLSRWQFAGVLLMAGMPYAILW